ncbi:class I SAM-dependent methyltransferase [Agitococcus lubricus]|uniref:Ribosomal RNA small subunit methyltransferase J n=1 Tax=Agitococcus lubricus TaxID=1077255 RepID=A0A2T5IZB6_9GAMM|nr:class I SAM-dependent methyltransferase [Agitococcus lubricus]PTQ89342.1 16S rRNA (guanine1516-N2)-methyltransferase [Agitococcus lubricus]
MFILYLADYQLQAEELASILGIEAFLLANTERKTLLAWQSHGQLAILLAGQVALQPLSKPLPHPVMVDWGNKTLLWRLQHGGGRGELLAKACGIKKEYLPKVIDATAGFGRDSLLLASLGCQVTLVERSPLVAAMLRDGWQRAALEPYLAPILPRMALHQGNATTFLQHLSPLDYPDVVYLDPMFPDRHNSAKVKQDMQSFHLAVGADDDADTLLVPALAVARKRVVVKRPRHATPLAGQIPSLVYEGESSRFDVYVLS